MVSLLRTIRLDPSDGILFHPAAEPGEWAVPGGFLWHGRRFEALSGKERVAYRSAFLGVESFGFSTLTVVTPVTPAEREAATEALARAFVAHLGAPDIATARAAAEEEIALSVDLCRGHEEGRLIALHRGEDAQGEITERFRALRPKEGTVWAQPSMAGHERPFQFVETEETQEDEGEAFDLLGGLRQAPLRGQE